MFWTVSLIKSPRVLRWSWILNECNLSCKQKKNGEILHFVRGMIKTAPHSNLSPQMWYIKNNNKRLVCTHPDLLARICKLVERIKNRPDLFSKNLFSTPYLLWSRAIIALKCDRRLFFGCTYKAISSRYKICFTPKSLLWNTKLLFDLSYKFINGSFAFSCG